MKPNDVLQILIFVFALVGLAPILGVWIYRVFTRPTGRLEKWIYKFSGINPHQEMSWREFLKAVFMFNLFGFLWVFGILFFQSPAISWHLAFNTAISFMTNTNWQSYAGETTMSHLSQMLALASQNFLSAATGFAVFLALVRGLSKAKTSRLGNFWVDVTRSVLYILIPLSFVLALVLVGQGVIQNFASDKSIQTLEGASQIIPGGPAASQIAIKQLGTNGGGFFNANSAHPFENPTPFSNFLQMLSLVLIPAALTFTFGKFAGSMRQGWTLFLVMFFVWSLSLAGSLASEYAPNPALGIHQANMEGKEVRFGVTNSLMWSTLTTMASNGSVNSMHSSLSPLAGGIALFNIMLGEVIFGGVGSGLYGMLLFVLLTVFLSGLMVGRSPEYLGKKIETQEMKWVILGILAPCAVILFGVALAVLHEKGNPHGFSEILYAFTSAAGNNGSAFAGLNANTPFYNVSLGIAMLIGRFAVIIPVLRIAGSLSLKKISPASSGTFMTDNTLFAALLIGVILIVGALTFLPALSLGPLIEHFLMLKGQTL